MIVIKAGMVRNKEKNKKIDKHRHTQTQELGWLLFLDSFVLMAVNNTLSSGMGVSIQRHALVFEISP